MGRLSEQTYMLVRQVPAGRVTTYKEVAHALNTRSYRAIGQIMRKNPYAPDVPCHRVVASDGTIGGFRGNAAGADITEKKAMLQAEGIRFQGNKIKDFEKIRFSWLP